MTKTTANILGVSSLIGWSLNVAVTRHIAEAHHFGMPGLSYLTAGVLLIAFDLLRRKEPPWRSTADRRFWLLGGSAFVIYIVCYILSLSLADTRDAVLPLGLVNYFWPALILALMPAFFPCRVRWAVLSAGMVLCVIGVGCAMLWGLNLTEMAKGLLDNWQAFVIMLAAAFLWAFYTNATRKWGGNANGTGWFMLISGLVLLGMWRLSGEPLGFSREMTVSFLLHAVVVNAVSYMIWDLGARHGDLKLLGLLANFLPLGSILFGAWYLAGTTTPGLWLGAALVVLGALLCRKGLDDSPPPSPEPAGK